MIGVMQGVTEFIPVSSSGHLILVYHLLGVNDIPILFDILLHLSTLMVIIVIYRSQIKRLIQGAVSWVISSNRNPKLFITEKKTISLLFFSKTVPNSCGTLYIYRK